MYEMSYRKLLQFEKSDKIFEIHSILVEIIQIHNKVSFL